MDFSAEYVGLKTAFDVILDDMFEIVGADLKLTSKYAYDPVDEMIKTTTGEHSDGIWTKGNNLNYEIQFVSYNNAIRFGGMVSNFTFLESLTCPHYLQISIRFLLLIMALHQLDSKALSGDDKIDALLPEVNSDDPDKTASYFLTDPYYSTTLDTNVIGDDTVITYSFVPSGIENQYFLDTAKADGPTDRSLVQIIFMRLVTLTRQLFEQYFQNFPKLQTYIFMKYQILKPKSVQCALGGLIISGK